MAEADKRSRQVIAHHEAAHAVVAIELGHGILDIGIDLDRFDRTGGIGLDGCRIFIADLTALEPQDLESEQLRLEGQIDRNGTVLAAGAASEAKLSGEDPWVALHRQPGDLGRMRELLQKAKLAPTEDAESGRLRTQLALAMEVLEDPMVWQAVQAVADAAMTHGSLSGSEIERITESILAPHETL